MLTSRQALQSVWYIGAMIFKTLAMGAALLALGQATTPPAPKPSPAQAAPASTAVRPVTQPSAKPASAPPSATHPVTPSATHPAAQPVTQPSSATADCNGFPCDDQQPQRPLVVNIPAPPPTPWLWRERLSWGSNILLAVMGYFGIMMALSVLKKIERQTRSAETAAAAAAVSAQAALLNAQAIIDAERPWLLISVEPSLGQENTFIVMVTNRGRTPASIVSMSEQIRIAIDETHLPPEPEYDKPEPSAPLVPIILLPGEASGIKTFSRDEARGVCESDEKFKLVESWEQKIYIYGKVVYRDLTAPPDNQTHETSWCCWYIHGRQKSGLVIAGPQGYKLHT